METVSDARRRFAYHVWATGEITAAIDHDARACALMAHACTADDVWRRRLRGEDTSGTELWPALTPADVRALAERNAGGWSAYLAGVGDAELSRPVHYVNSRGDRFATPVADILEHVLLHGAYHRGQAAASIRAAGAAPPATDFIVWARGGGGGRKTEDRGQKTEDSRQKTVEDVASPAQRPS